MRAPLSKQTSTSTGSSDSEATAFAVIPCGPSGASTVTTATPVAKCPMTARKRSGSTVSHLTTSVPYMPSSSWFESAQKKR